MTTRGLNYKLAGIMLSVAVAGSVSTCSMNANAGATVDVTKECYTYAEANHDALVHQALSVEKIDPAYSAALLLAAANIHGEAAPPTDVAGGGIIVRWDLEAEVAFFGKNGCMQPGILHGDDKHLDVLRALADAIYGKGA